MYGVNWNCFLIFFFAVLMQGRERSGNGKGGDLAESIAGGWAMHWTLRGGFRSLLIALLATKGTFDAQNEVKRAVWTHWRTIGATKGV